MVHIPILGKTSYHLQSSMNHDLVQVEHIVLITAVNHGVVHINWRMQAFKFVATVAACSQIWLHVVLGHQEPP